MFSYQEYVFAVLLAALLSCPASAQETNAHKSGLLHIEPLIGNSWQSEYFHPFFDWGRPTLYPVLFPYDGWKNTQGFGLDPGVNAYIDISKHSAAGIWLNSRLRYDYVYGYGGVGRTIYKDNHKDFLVDLNAGLQYKLITSGGRSMDVVAGMTVHQVGKKYFFAMKQYGWLDGWVKYQYFSYDLRLGYDIIRLGSASFIHAGMAASYIPNGHPAYPFTDFMLLKVYAQVKFKGIRARIR